MLAWHSYSDGLVHRYIYCDANIWILNTNPNKEKIFITFHQMYSGEDKTSVKALGADISINNAWSPINLGAKWKLLISRFQNSSWMLDLELNWPSYDRETKPNFSLKFMFLSYSYRFRSIDSFETFYNSSWVQFFCHISVNLAPNVTSRESFGI